MTFLIIGLILFLGAHSVSIIGPSWRDGIVARIGKAPWQGIYSLVALGGLLLTIYGYGLARQEPVILYLPPTWLHHVAWLLMIPFFALFLAPYFPGRIKTAVKHPMLTATKLWAVAHLLANGMLADVILFGSFLIWATADRASMRYREQIPLSGAAPSKWNDAILVIVGLAIYAAFVGGLHMWLFGVPVGTPWG